MQNGAQVARTTVSQSLLRARRYPALLAAALLLAIVACQGNDGASDEPVGDEPITTPTVAVEVTATPSAIVPTPPTPAATSGPDVPVSACEGDGPRVCLVQLADFGAPSVGSLARHLVDQGIPAGVLPAVDLEFSDIDPARGQLSANQAAARIEAAYPDLIADPDVTLIGLTDVDIFVEERTYNWVFGMRGPGALVISTARMYQEIWGSERDDSIRDSRLRKMLLRYVGLFHLDLPQNESPLTVLYAHLDGLTQLDAMREGILEPSQLPQPSTAVEVWAHEFCAASEATQVRIYDADVILRRTFTVEMAAEDARPVIEGYLDALAAARVEYHDALSAIFPLAEAVQDERSAVPAFHALLQRTVGNGIDHVQFTLSEIESLDTTAEITGRFVELTVQLWTDPDLVPMYDAYEQLPADALVAMVNAGPCGGFAPEQFYEGPLI